MENIKYLKTQIALRKICNEKNGTENTMIKPLRIDISDAERLLEYFVKIVDKGLKDLNPNLMDKGHIIPETVDNERRAKIKIRKCMHGKQKMRCKECSRSKYCEHDKRRDYCKECEGRYICEHGKIKSNCMECGGSRYCEHGKEKNMCKRCGGSSLCKSEWCETIGNRKYEGYCLRCYVYKYPDRPNARNYKTKEYAVVEKIKESYPDFDWKSDKRVEDGCSRRRPDLLLDLGSHIIIVEVDENKHSSYDCTCEHRRLMEISRDLQHRPIVLIRFNPDGYTNQCGLKVQSCWKQDGHGYSVIRNKEMWEMRITRLKEEIEYWIENKSDKMIEIVEMYY
jgi:hypothetical protein